MNPVDLKLYLVTDSGYYDEKRFLDMVEKACRGGVTLLQLREKNRGGREYLAPGPGGEGDHRPRGGAPHHRRPGWT